MKGHFGERFGKRFSERFGVRSGESLCERLGESLGEKSGNMFHLGWEPCSVRGWVRGEMGGGNMIQE